MRRKNHGEEEGPQCRGGAASARKRSHSEERPQFGGTTGRRSHGEEEGPQCGGGVTVSRLASEEEPQ